MKEVSVSILSLMDKKELITKLNDSNCDYIHFDVMDGKFVKNKFLTIKELTSLIDITKKKVDIHLMLANPLKYIEALSLYNISYITIHYEIEDFEKYISLIKSYGIKVGVAINPKTDVECIYPILKDIDLVLVMGVNPGASGQTFIPDTKDKINKLKQKIMDDKLNVKVSVDGGVSQDCLYNIRNADIIVSSSFVLNDFNNIDVIKNI